MKKTFDFDFDKGEFNLKNGSPVVLTGIDALKLWIQKTLHTESKRYPMYNGKNYGVNIEDIIIGKSYDLDFVKSELQREIETALLRHDDIISISGFETERNGSAIKISFTVSTVYGAVEEAYTYDN